MRFDTAMRTWRQDRSRMLARKAWADSKFIYWRGVTGIHMHEREGAGIIVLVFDDGREVVREAIPVVDILADDWVVL